MAVKQKASRNFHEKVFEIIEFESFGTIETSKGFQHKVHKRISKGIVLVTFLWCKTCIHNMLDTQQLEESLYRVP